ncbi:unnamed protein product [Cunninghamella blakesleeana]
MLFSKLLTIAGVFTIGGFSVPLHNLTSSTHGINLPINNLVADPKGKTDGNSTSTTGGDGDIQVTLINQCSYGLTVAKLTNKESEGEQASLSAGSKKVYSLPNNWGGRFFGRKHCAGAACTVAGASKEVPPASLAEFTFRGWGGNDYYDISLVDGFNLPMKIEPIGGKGGNASGKYKCGSPTCKKLPTCENGFQVSDKGQFASCLSACSKFNTDEYCCRGEFGTPDKCQASQYSKSLKSACPDAYSFAYDDTSSTYSCVATGYTVTFCP